MNTRNIFHTILTTTLMASLHGSDLRAATINWVEPPVSISTVGDGIVDTTGTFVYGINYSSSALDRTVNGVTFTGQTTADAGWTAPVFNTGFYSDGGVGTDFAVVLDSFMFGDSPSPTSSTETLTLNGLAVGKNYLVQLFVSDDRATGNLNTRTQNFTGGSSVSGTYANGLSYSILGTFIADATTQDILFTSFPGSSTNGVPIINALQVREIVPEPSTAMLLGLALCGVALRRNRHRVRTAIWSRSLSAVAVAACLCISTAHAGTVSVNGSFEDQVGSITPDTSSPTFGDVFASLTGWTYSGSGNLLLANGDFGPIDGPPYFAGNGSNIPYQFPTDGDTFLDFDTANYTLSQTISVAGAGTASVSFDLNRLQGNAPTGATTARVELFDGNSVAAPSLYDSGVINVLGLTQETWTSFSSGSLHNTGSQLFLQLTLFDSASSALGAIDNVLVDHVVPEPSTALLIGLGSIALLIRRR